MKIVLSTLPRYGRWREQCVEEKLHPLTTINTCGFMSELRRRFRRLCRLKLVLLTRWIGASRCWVVLVEEGASRLLWLSLSRRRFAFHHRYLACLEEQCCRAYFATPAHIVLVIAFFTTDLLVLCLFFLLLEATGVRAIDRPWVVLIRYDRDRWIAHHCGAGLLNALNFRAAEHRVEVGVRGLLLLLHWFVRPALLVWE